MGARVLAVFVSVISCTAMAADAGCKTNPALTGHCLLMRGTVLLTADIGPVLDSDIGARRLIIRAAPNSTKDMPAKLVTLMSSALHKSLSAEVHGTYEVCPIPTLPSQFPPETTQYACINSASHLSLGDWSPKHEGSN